MTLNVEPRTSAKDLLNASGERVTRARVVVFEVLLAAPRALTHAEIIEAALGRELVLDRVTLYRVLEWLVARGHAHRIEGHDRVWRFNSVPGEARGHAHFHCERCARVYCLEDLQPAVAVGLPDGYSLSRAELTLYGECPACRMPRAGHG
ncbi:MAG: Fur family transcriptional regulator [Thiotrichales bacterium]